MQVVTLEGAIVLAGGFPALAGINLDISRGEIVLLRGVNGAGKSSLLHLIGGLTRASSGKVNVLDYDLSPGSDAAQRAAVRRRVGMVGHDAALYGDLTAVENLKFFAGISRVGTQGVGDALERVQLPERTHDVPAGQLSAGQRQRVALAALIVRRAELWLLDEPHAGLDTSGCDLVDDVVREAATAGATVIMASHEHCQDLATRIVTLTGGIVTADSSSSFSSPPASLSQMSSS